MHNINNEHLNKQTISYSIMQGNPLSINLNEIKEIADNELDKKNSNVIIKVYHPKMMIAYKSSFVK